MIFCLVFCFNYCKVCEMKLCLIVLTDNGTCEDGSLVKSLGGVSSTPFVQQDICSLEILRARSSTLAALRLLQPRALGFLSHIDPLNSGSII